MILYNNKIIVQVHVLVLWDPVVIHILKDHVRIKKDTIDGVINYYY